MIKGQVALNQFKATSARDPRRPLSYANVRSVQVRMRATGMGTMTVDLPRAAASGAAPRTGRGVRRRAAGVAASGAAPGRRREGELRSLDLLRQRRRARRFRQQPDSRSRRRPAQRRRRRRRRRHRSRGASGPRVDRRVAADRQDREIDHRAGERADPGAHRHRASARRPADQEQEMGSAGAAAGRRADPAREEGVRREERGDRHRRRRRGRRARACGSWPRRSRTSGSAARTARRSTMSKRTSGSSWPAGRRPGRRRWLSTSCEKLAEQLKGKALESAHVKVSVEKADRTACSTSSSARRRRRSRRRRRRSTSRTATCRKGATLIDDEFEIPSEVDEFWSKLRTKVIPGLKKRQAVVVEARLSEPPEMRRRIEQEARAELIKAGAARRRPRSRCSPPTSRATAGSTTSSARRSRAKPSIGSRSSSPRSGRRQAGSSRAMYAPTRWLLEIYPIDEILAARLEDRPQEHPLREDADRIADLRSDRDRHRRRRAAASDLRAEVRRCGRSSIVPRLRAGAGHHRLDQGGGRRPHRRSTSGS